MTDKYYDYIIDTLQDIISDISTHLAFTEGHERQYEKGKMDAYVDIMHMIYDDHEKGFKGDNMEYMTLSNIKYSYDINNGDYKVSFKVPDEIFKLYSEKEIADYIYNILERMITGSRYGKK